MWRFEMGMLEWISADYGIDWKSIEDFRELFIEFADGFFCE